MNTAPMMEFSSPLRSARVSGLLAASRGAMFDGIRRNTLAVLGRFHLYSTPCIIAVECLPGVEPRLNGQSFAAE